MIDISIYRIRIGCYNTYRRAKSKSGRSNQSFSVSDRFLAHSYGDLLCIAYLYIVCMLLFVCQSLLISMRNSSSEFDSLYWGCPRILPNYRGWDLPTLSNIHADLLYFCLISFILKRLIRYMNTKGDDRFCNFTAANIFFANKTTKIRQLFSTILLFILISKFLMIAIINPSIKNPGPRNLSVFYQNVQGLIPFSSLGKDDPNLNRSKIFELNAHITIDKPDLVLLNETWLEKSIKSREVIESNLYDVFRCDRSQLSHPSDPDDPRKF